ncbi:MAG: hypothetical protein MUC97_05065 [Bernardetiaceae bacterium]|jgi:hypothetical protein|nr:hypothetical protein [Bernardetiaceae bacterium]
MKLWRDLKLLALGTGLLALDGCQDRMSDATDDRKASIIGKIIAWEQCQEYGYLVVAVTELPYYGPPKESWRVVGGEYGGRYYPSLLRLRSRDPLRPDNERTAVGACGRLVFEREPLSQPCVRDQVPVYWFFDSGAQPGPGCSNILDRK